jgi:hypothetical protein
MLYLAKLLLLLININQETVLNWFGVENPNNKNVFSQTLEGDNVNLSNIEVEPASTLSLGTLKLIVDGLCQRVQDGLTLADIEELLFFILFIRFVILAIRYNLKTSFYITCIGLFAGYLWYKHLIDLISMYRSILIKIPYLQKLGMDAVQLRAMSRQMAITDLKLGEDVHWYNPVKLLYHAFTKGITNMDSETGHVYFIDPISMLISNLNQSDQAKVLPVYYKIYHTIIPHLFKSCGKFWNQLSGIAAYAVITRIGKRYCPYLVRWHWTFLLIIGFMEQILVYFVYRVVEFQTAVLIPQTQDLQDFSNYIDKNLVLQVNALNGLIAFIICLHLGLIFFGLFHAIWGQYFYIPFFVENTELHVGPRPKNSLYSGGNTVWQDEKDKNAQRFFPKLWFGWFGGGNSRNWKILRPFQKLLSNVLKILKKRFRK